MKKLIAGTLHIVHIDELMLRRIGKRLKNNYIRIINYHDTPAENADAFEKQLKWYSQRFQNVDKTLLEGFVNGYSSFGERPGILLTFDDGYSGNFVIAKSLLEKYGFTGCFFVSSDLVGTDGYMTWEELRSLADSGHIIGCHTATHWRMNQDDSTDKLQYEIIESKHILERGLNQGVDWFAWCGGEEEHYTVSAAKKIIEAGYHYAFLTNSEPVTHGKDPYQLERTNVESGWSIALTQFQVCGMMDFKCSAKRKRVEALTLEGRSLA